MAAGMLDGALAVIDLAAAEYVGARIAARAAEFAATPKWLATLRPGLTAAAPAEMIAMIDDEIARELARPRRRIGFGGEVPMINLRAARAYATRLLEDTAHG